MADEPKAYKAKLSDFKPDPRNLNKHTQRGQNMVEASQRQRGYGRPAFAAQDGTVLGGNLSTMEVAPDIGLGDGEVFVVETSGNLPIIHLRTDIEAGSTEAVLLAAEDNQSALVSIDFDAERMAEELAQGVDFGGIFNEDELKGILDGLGDEPTDPPDPPPVIDKADELQDKWQCEPGQIWQIESATNPGHYHRLICGDCRDIATVEALTDGAKVNGVFTSPPYAMQRAKQYGGVETDEYVEWWEQVQGNVRAVLAEDGSFFVNIKPHCKDGQRVLYVFDLVLAMVRRWGWRLVDELCWRKNGSPGVFGDRFRNDYEPVYHWSFGKCKIRPENVMMMSERVPTSSLSNNSTGQGVYGKELYSREKGEARPGNVIVAYSGFLPALTGHVAQFPVSLPTFFIKAYSDPLDLWLDPFTGSGTTMLACENEARLGLGIEKLEKYCAVILERMTDNGMDPILTEESIASASPNPT